MTVMKMTKTMKNKYLFLALMLLLGLFLFAGCSEKKDAAEEKWEGIEESGKNTAVNIVGDFSDEELKWLKKNLKSQLKNKYGLKLSFESLNPEELTNLLASYEGEEQPRGEVDLALVRAPEFAAYKKGGLIYGPFTADIPNYRKYISDRDYTQLYADLEAVEGRALAFYQNQLHFFYDDDVLFDPPEGLEALEHYLAKNPGSFTYPNPKTPEGRRFVESVILEFVSERELHKPDLSEDELRSLTRPGLDYLRRIKPYLQGSGRYYPFEREDYEALFREGRIKIIMSLNHRHADYMVGEGLYPERMRSLRLLTSSAADSSYFVIPTSSTNKSGALLVLNYLLEPSIQTELYNNDDMPSTLIYSEGQADDEVAKIDEASRKKTVMKASKVLEIKKSRLPDTYWDYIFREWAKL